MMTQGVFVILMQPQVSELLIHWKLGKLLFSDPTFLFIPFCSRKYSWVMTESACAVMYSSTL